MIGVQEFGVLIAMTIFIVLVVFLYLSTSRDTEKAFSEFENQFRNLLLSRNWKTRVGGEKLRDQPFFNHCLRHYNGRTLLRPFAIRESAGKRIWIFGCNQFRDDRMICVVSSPTFDFPRVLLHRKYFLPLLRRQTFGSLKKAFPELCRNWVVNMTTDDLRRVQNLLGELSPIVDQSTTIRMIELNGVHVAIIGPSVTQRHDVNSAFIADLRQITKLFDGIEFFN